MTDSEPLTAADIEIARVEIDRAVPQLGGFNWRWALGAALDEIERVRARPVFDATRLDLTGLAVLEQIAHESYDRIRAAYSTAGKDVTSEAFHMHLAAKCGEEGMETLAAYLHATGWARRGEPWFKVDSEMADMVISAFILAYAENRDLISAIAEKVELIFSRGWKDV